MPRSPVDDPRRPGTDHMKAIWGPVMHDGRSQFPLYAELGAGLYQYTLTWDTVATDRPGDPRDPSDPAYRWPEELDVDRQTQADWLEAAFDIVESSPRIHTLGWFRLRDQPPNERGDQANWELIDNDGRRKPAFGVFARVGR